MLDRLDAINATAEVRLINQIFLGNMLPQTVVSKAAQAHAKANPTRPPQKAQQPIPFSGTPLQGKNERLIPKAKPEPVPKGQPEAIHIKGGPQVKPAGKFSGTRGQRLSVIREVGPPPSPTPKRQNVRVQNKAMSRPPPKPNAPTEWTEWSHISDGATPQ